MDSLQEWNWPQNLVYSVILRIYYDPDILPDKPEVIIPRTSKVGIPITLITDNPDQIREVVFIGKYHDVNYEGDGRYVQWHYNYYRGEIMNFLGKTAGIPFETLWDTEWIPDQPEPVFVSALVHYQDGLICFTEPSGGITLNRNEVRVLLCRPSGQPEKWTTRAGEFSTRFYLDVSPQDIVDCQLVWASWSPCYANGIYINDLLVFIREAPCYDFKFHRVILEDKRSLREGLNVIRTGQTPLDREGNMVHGMDVQWPGIMVLVKVRK